MVGKNTAGSSRAGSFYSWLILWAAFLPTMADDYGGRFGGRGDGDFFDNISTG